MKRIFKFVAYGVAIFLVLILAFVGWIVMTKPNVGPPDDITVERTPERIKRGEYLATHVMLCMDCHSERDFSLFSGPITPGTEGSGGEVFDQSMEFPGRFVSPNITPAGIGDWTDGELYQAITCGVTKDGRALFPIMPYPNFAKMDPEDIKDVIAYIRTLTPIEVQRESSKADFPMNIIIKTIPQKTSPGNRPDPSNTVAYGEYLATAASCGDCHTKMEKGEFVGEFLSGGQPFHMPDGSVVTSHNLTPDKTGIGDWSKDKFIQTFKQYSDSNYIIEPVQKGRMQSIMPWIMYSGMESSDLAAIYDYLRSLDPVDNEVVKYVPPLK